MEIRKLPFHELFCEPNPFYFPQEPEDLIEDDASNPSTSSIVQNNPNGEHSERESKSTLLSPWDEPAISESAKDPASCFDYTAEGTRRPAHGAPYEWNPDWRLLRDFLKREGRLELNAALELVKRTRNVLQKEPNVIHLRPPFTLVGDVHGQYYDLLSMFEKAGDPENTPYLFLGDYVDRGMFGCEIVFLLCALKLCYPNTFYMIRGNHECRLLTAHFTFLRETQKKYRSQRLYDEVMLLFDALPLGVIIEDEESRFLCVHGGLSPDLHTIEDISNVYRFQEPGKSGALCDLLWSDPLEEETAQGLSASDMQEWYEVRFEENASRGCGWIFGYAAAKEFIDRNNLTAIIRAHEVQRAGYGLNKFQKPTPETLVITVFSAPNYCDFYANKAAVMKISPPRYDTGDEADEHTRLEFVQFDNVPHPFLLPKLQDGIEYTMPFLVDKLKQILSYLISKKGLGEEDAEEKQFYGAIDQMMERHRIASSPSRQDSSEPSSSNAGRQRPSVPIPRSPSGRLLTHVRKITNPTPEKQFLSVKDRIDMLHKDAASKAELVKRLSETRGGLIQGKILQNRITAYLSKATSKFQRAKQEDWLNECRPDSH